MAAVSKGKLESVDLTSRITVFLEKKNKDEHC